MSFVRERKRDEFHSSGERLREAAKQGKVDQISLLISNKANLESKDGYGNTALILAAESVNEDCVEELIRAKARVNAKDNFGQTALMHAVSRGNAQISDMLLKHGAHTNDATKFGQTALMKAAYTIHHHTHYNIESLLEKKADPNLKDKDGRTALMIACELNKLNSAISMIDAGADVNAAAKDGTTALIIAGIHGNYDLIETLVSKGANIDAKTGDGNTVKTVKSKLSVMGISDPDHTRGVQIAVQSGLDIRAGKKSTTLKEEAEKQREQDEEKAHMAKLVRLRQVADEKKKAEVKAKVLA